MSPATAAIMLAHHTRACIAGQADFEPCRCRPPAVIEPEVRR